MTNNCGRLKKKDELHYAYQRKGAETICCTCNHWVPDFKRMGIAVFGGNKLLSVEPRCLIMGLGNSIRYRVRYDHGCDAHNNSEYMAKHGG